MGKPVLYALGTKSGETYQFEIDPSAPTVARLAAVAVAQVAATQAADLAALKSAYPAWQSASSAAKWIGGCPQGAYYLITARVYDGSRAKPRDAIRLVVATASACLSLCFATVSVDANVSYPPAPALLAFDGTTAYLQVPGVGPYSGGLHKTAMLLLAIDGSSSLEARAYLGTPNTGVLVSLGTENVIATEICTERPS